MEFRGVSRRPAWKRWPYGVHEVGVGRRGRSKVFTDDEKVSNSGGFTLGPSGRGSGHTSRQITIRISA